MKKILLALTFVTTIAQLPTPPPNPPNCSPFGPPCKPPASCPGYCTPLPPSFPRPHHTGVNNGA
jgi:hypothetical protein